MTEDKLFNRELARELLAEEIGNYPSEELLDHVLSISENPWDAPILYRMILYFLKNSIV